MKGSIETRVKVVIARYFNLPPSKVGLDAAFVGTQIRRGQMLRLSLKHMSPGRPLPAQRFWCIMVKI